MKAAMQGDELRKFFQMLDPQFRHALADLSAGNLIFVVLSLSEDKCGIEYLTLRQIEEAIEAASVSVSGESVRMALRRAGRKIHRKTIDGKICYKVSMLGRREVQDLLDGEGVMLMHVLGNKPRTDRKKLSVLLESLSGTIRICDPYYGIKTLDALEMFHSARTVMFLTGRADSSEQRFLSQLPDFKTEHPNTEIRKYPRMQEMHDRYVITDDKILIIGHGLKDIGGKESFIIALDKSLAPDMWASMVSTFDTKWSQATAI